jgi:hypothetical protein
MLRNGLRRLILIVLAKNPSQEELILASVSAKRKRSSVVDEPDLNMNDRDKNESQKVSLSLFSYIVTNFIV